MSETIIITALGPADLDRLLCVPADLFDTSVRPDEARRYLANPENLILLAEIGGVVAGFVSGTVLRHPDKAPWFFVNELGTREGYRRRGVASALLKDLAGRGVLAGWETIWLATETDNAPARATYSRLSGAEEHVVSYSWSPKQLRRR